MSKNLETPTKLTEFAPLDNEEKQDSVSELFSKFFGFGKSSRGEQSTSTESSDVTPNESMRQWSNESLETHPNVVYDLDVAEGRSLPSVLKRISNLLVLKSTNYQAYSDSKLKKYWMPDSVSKECYECCEKFTTFRRKHHCRVCGQIFCSSCCNQQISGKIFGCAGNLRVCTYCCKVVLSYLQSSDIGSDLTTDLRSLQENLQSKYGPVNSSSLNQSTSSPNSSSCEPSESSGARRKISVGYQEEKFASGRGNNSYLSTEEKCRALQNSASLRNLYEEICKPNTGIALRKQRHRLRVYEKTFFGSELVDWLIYQQKANTRVQAAAFCQALLDGGYIICMNNSPNFIDSNSVYKLGIVPSTQLLPNQSQQRYDTLTRDEPTWAQEIPQDTNDSDSESEQTTPTSLSLTGGMKPSSSYALDLNVGANTVYLSRPPVSSSNLQFENTEESERKTDNCEETPASLIRSSEQCEFGPKNWHNASHLSEENGENMAYKLLTSAFEQHESSLLKQLLTEQGLSLSWNPLITNLVHDTINNIRPDVDHNAEELDIRNYVQFKNLPGGSRADCQLVKGIVFNKNVAHKAMKTRLENPRILLMECPIVYQRTEGRLMSLDPVLMQEQQYLTYVSERIIALKPDIVLVQRNVSRLAQDILRERGITIVLNVKLKVLERIARCTDADLVSSIDARIGTPKLGTCKLFRLQTYDVGRGSKTLMFFEGLPKPHLGATVLLRGASTPELASIKAIASFLLFACYNWRLEKSFLMDEFAYPRKDEFFDDSKESSPTLPTAELTMEDDERHKKKIVSNNELFGSSESDTEYFNAAKTESKKYASIKDTNIVSESVQDFSDPLHSYTDNVFNDTQKLSVAELPFSNQFRKALDDTILSVSPFLVFTIPYLETETGRKCELRKFFPSQIYSSEQFLDGKKKKVLSKEIMVESIHNEYMLPPHEFLATKICASIDSKEIQTLLASFRAEGGRFMKKPLSKVRVKSESPPPANPEENLDVLNPRNHQRIAVLFCSYSHESINAPAFCVNPWVVYMTFYGQNDIPLGCFLMRYCFAETYHCQSKCDTLMLKHVRRFVHYNGCVSISLSLFHTEKPDDNIIMWSFCTRCEKASPAVSMSVDTWSYSFAKYLEQRFHGNIYSIRGSTQCKHSLHQDHYQYFAYGKTVALFKYTPIDLWEISLPPTLIDIKYILDAQQSNLIDEIKIVELKGHETYSFVQDKLSLLPCNDEIVVQYKQSLAKEMENFKMKVREVQVKLTSPTIEKKHILEKDTSEAQSAIWQVSDAIVRLKGIIVESADQWNGKLSEIRKKDDKRKDNKTSSMEVDSPVISDTRGIVESENELSSGSSVQKEDLTSSTKMATRKNRSLDKGSEDDLSSSPRGHQRSQSDGTVLNQVDDVPDGKKDNTPKVVKSRFSLFSTTQSLQIPVPFNNKEHYSMQSGAFATIAVYESEPSSVIAHALNSYEYKKKFDEMTNKRVFNESPSPGNRRRHQSEKERSESGDYGGEKSSGLKSFFRTKDSKSDLLTPDNSQTAESVATTDKPDDLARNKIEVQFVDSSCKFLCSIYFAEKFATLRKMILPMGEEGYVRSLSRCLQWNARGGKSGSTFCKTADDRFILKQMPQKEIQLFLESAHNYFNYMQKCLNSEQPTLLGKIVGIYQIVYKNYTSNDTLKTHFLVMENLFYNRVVMQKFDLKGSVRNRLVNPDNEEGEIVLLDENLLKMTCDNPLYIHPHSKEVLTAAIQNDTEFLSSQFVMDYSLLVGLDCEKKELVVGIIDYIRTFTWDKRLETIVKKTGILGGQGKLPTIMPPQEYQKRFIEAMHRYFLEVPDPWAGLGRGLLES